MSSAYTAVANINTEILTPEKGILSHTIHNDNDIKLVLFGFARGEELSAHTAPMPAVIHVISGEAALTLGQDQMDVQAGAVIHMAPNLTHSIVARTPLLMLLTLVKAARLTE